MLVRRLKWMCEPEEAFASLFGDSKEAFWLDGNPDLTDSRFSFMGDASGPLARAVSYDAGRRSLRVCRTDGAEEMRSESIFSYLERELDRLRSVLATSPSPQLDIPFDLTCGFVGFLGYELGTEAVEAPPRRSLPPDAAFVLADRMIAFDAHERAIWLLELGPGSEWLDETEARLCEIAPLPHPAFPTDQHGGEVGVPSVSRDLDPEAYRKAIERCRREIARGESYEVCLTTQLRAQLGEAGETTLLDPFELYRVLRRVNPAPYSAYLRFGDLAVLSSSPERFLKLDRDRMLESKPIKGTAARSPDAREDERLAAELAADPKNRAENVMIADLMRNDLGRVCEIGSVEVPALAALESYAGAHQLVTTVRGRLRADRSAVDAVRAAFPPGSMTGAPKIRTMEIIDELEPAPRGVYSGCLGYFSLNGSADLSVVIRTIVVREGSGEHGRGELSIGTGGAITALSDPEDELAELEVKAAPLLHALLLASAGQTA